MGIQRCTSDGRPFATRCECITTVTTFAVSPRGSDSSPGTISAPFLTLGRAQQAVASARAAGMTGDIRVWLREGSWELTAGLVLDGRHGGSDGGITTWSGYPGERARLVGGRTLAASDFTLLSPSSPLFSRLDPAARGVVRAVTLTVDGGTLLERGAMCGQPGRSALELLVDGAPQQLARWPDEDEDTQQHPDVNANTLEVYGWNPVPDVRGTYTRIGTSDGVSVFRRNGLVGGLQYHLYRMSWLPHGVPFTSWYLTTNSSNYPTSNPFWYLGNHELDDMAPANGAQGWVSFKNVAALERGFALVARENSPTSFGYSGTRPSRWTQATDLWLHGMLRFEWADCHQRVTSIDTTNQLLQLANAPPFGIGQGHRWYAENLVEELTRPGEWWLDRSSNTLLFWPPSSWNNARRVTVTTLEEPLVTITDAAFITLENLDLEGGRSIQVVVRRSNDVRVRNVRLSGAGADAVILDGTRLSVEHARISSSGNAGVVMRGGDRLSLTAGANAVTDSTIEEAGRWEWTYRAAIVIEGVGHRAEHNVIRGHPHTGILFWGNDHVMAHNDISFVCRLARDSGAIYSGRDWGYRGNVIRANAIHDVRSGLGWDVHGVYLDDCLSGVEVTQNVFDRITGYGVMHGGGTENVMSSNVFSQTQFALGADRRCTVTVNNLPGDTWNLLEKLRSVNYQQPPWSTRYPTVAAIPNDWNIVSTPDAGWLEPRACRFSSNVGDGYGQFERLSDRFVLPAFAEIAHNRPDAGSLFIDGGYSMNPAISTPGFVPFPASQLGVRPY